jgi:hypothetical protein
MKETVVTAVTGNVLFAAGVVLLVVGTITGVMNLGKMLLLEEYPLDMWMDQMCTETIIRDELSWRTTDSGDPITIDQDDIDRRVADCEQSSNKKRDAKKITDSLFSVSSLGVGAILFVVFRRHFFLDQRK